MKVEKLARHMEAWRYRFDALPDTVGKWLMRLDDGHRAVLVSPRAGTAHGPGSKAGIVIETGWWIIRADTGCLYAVSDEDFRKKYRPAAEAPWPRRSPAERARLIRLACELRNGLEP